jgi:hypothetical protein
MLVPQLATREHFSLIQLNYYDFDTTVGPKSFWVSEFLQNDPCVLFYVAWYPVPPDRRAHMSITDVQIIKS